MSLNYRLGAFGWLSGPTFQQANGTANAGLHDQRFALEWVQQNIHLFGGDPRRVTVFGESAGGGSIMHQITAYGGKSGPVAFAQAVLQSPAFWPVVSNQQQEQTFNSYLSLLNVSTIEEARELPSSELLAANFKQISLSTYGKYTYGPAVDGDFVPALPGELLLHGQYRKGLKVMVGHNFDEVRDESRKSKLGLVSDVRTGSPLHLALHPEQHRLRPAGHSPSSDSQRLPPNPRLHRRHTLPAHLRRQPGAGV